MAKRNKVEAELKAKPKTKPKTTKNLISMWLVLGFGLVIFSLPWISDKTKYWLAVPLYVLYFYVVYIVVFKKRSS